MSKRFVFEQPSETAQQVSESAPLARGQRTASELVLTEPPNIEGSASFARNRTLRLQLRRWWVERPKRWAAWLMLNPSDAGERRNDPTMLRVIHFSRSWGFDGCIAVNLYPFITSDPREMRAWSRWQDNGPDWYARDDMQGNLATIEEVGRASCLRVAAFGAEPATRDQDWVDQCVERFTQPFDYPNSGWGHQENCVCLGMTKTGQPIHPLARGRNRVSNDAMPILWPESRIHFPPDEGPKAEGLTVEVLDEGVTG